ncbi:MAG: hypothetical protein H6737_30820 [Alphaproteobacteria bacterium]|nr:hypothetical protein [Alphaproteobacteria bacterium]
MKRVLLLLLCGAAIPAFAEDGMVGRWTGGSMELSVRDDGRFDWSVGQRSTDGRWVADGRLVSMQTDRGEVTYAFDVRDDELTLFEADGTEIVMKRDRKRKKR